MAMYYQGGSEIQADGLHTLYLMNPNYVGYSDHPTNMLLMNSAGATSAHALNPTPVPHQLTPLLHTHQQAVSNPMAHDLNRSSSVISPQQQIQGPAFTTPRFAYNSWVDHPNVSHQASQGLSLSLSTNQTSFNKPVNGDQDFPIQTLPKTWSSSSHGVDSTLQSVIMGSKYLKAAQELLDEVANVGKSIISAEDKPGQGGSKDKVRIIKETDTGNNTGASSGGGELTTAQRQEMQMKKSKLINMLDEVEQRYRQYNVQMQIIVASFEQAAGIGTSESYTQLALKTISKQFRCLKDAILSQIKALSGSLGEEDKVEGPKLKYVANQLGQHRALQQLGMVQTNPWRPQRGLPERAVSVLRAWLFEHFLHPYPKDSDKQLLAKQTGLTRSQVSNWFINARVRLWKPMVEEMYLEEMKTQPQNNNTTNTSNSKNPNPNDQISASTVPTTPTRNSSRQTGPMSLAQLISPLSTENLSKKPRHDQDDSPSSILSVEMEMKSAGTNTSGPYGTSYNAFQELNRFNPGQMANAFHGNYNNTPNSVSLTLGLPPSGNSPGAHHHQNNSFLNFGTTTEAGLEDIGFDQMLGFRNRKQYPAQLLHSNFFA